MIAAKNMLLSFGLRHTDTRENIVACFLDQTMALSQSDLEETLTKPFDRITVYRTIKTFLEKGLIHKILDDQGGLKYALCKDSCSQGQHQHDHVHFKCVTCQQTTCIDNTFVPNIVLPVGYSRQEVNMLVHGVCPNCNV
jgi:Fur family transcriptional regulator, ferric uptake regulator